MHLMFRPARAVAHPAPVKARDVAVYAAVAIAVLALVVAAYAAMRPAQVVKTNQTGLPPSASATVNLASAVTLDAPGAYRVPLGWIYVSDAPAVVQLRANYSYTWFLLDGVNYGNPATAVLTPGNHTVDAIISAVQNGTKIKIEYAVLG